MPPKKQYTPAQTKAYNARKKKEKAKKPKPVIKQNQFRTEYKDRVSAVGTHILATVTGSVTNGPTNSLILTPGALSKLFGQGTLNGEVDGNNINARYLNMKVKINFDLLKAVFGTVPYQYNIQIYQGLILQDLREYLTGTHTNTSSGRVQPSFPNHTIVPAYWDDIAKKFLFNANMKPDYLSYEKRLDTQVRILKSWRVKGDQREVIAGGTAVYGAYSPEKHYTFNWKMPKNKMLLSPALNNSAVAGVAPSGMYVPFVMITMNTNHALGTGEHLSVSEISHFTYTDS